MTIYYCDHLGICSVKVEYYGIEFDHENGNALFSDENGQDYTIPIASILEII